MACRFDTCVSLLEAQAQRIRRIVKPDDFIQALSYAAVPVCVVSAHVKHSLRVCRCMSQRSRNTYCSSLLALCRTPYSPLPQLCSALLDVRAEWSCLNYLSSGRKWECLSDPRVRVSSLRSHSKPFGFDVKTPELAVTSEQPSSPFDKYPFDTSTDNMLYE